jgi:cyclopropane-fatty-acyl-phospholipid synthase
MFTTPDTVTSEGGVGLLSDARIAARLDLLPVPTALQLPDGTRLGPASPRVRISLHDAGLLLLLGRGEMGALAQAHVDGRLDLEGNLRDICAVVAELLPADPVVEATPHRLARSASRLLRAARSRLHHTAPRDRAQISFHYDISNDFYALWLDRRRVYSCAYWPRGVTTLEQAQEAKLELICRKLMLRPGERFLDIGAGWGALLLWAAERHGVVAHGITLSAQQHAHVERLIDERGLQGRVTMALCDYRELPEGEPYDKIASVGMFEHVGTARLTGYFAKIRRLLKPGGLLLNHGISAGGLHNRELGAGIGAFVERNIFPGGELVHISQVLAALSEAGLEGLDVENLRPHYARTLWAWSDALEARLEAARSLTSERVVRAYRLYLAFSALGFERGWMSLHQVLASRPSGRPDDGPMRGAQSVHPFQREHFHLQTGA